MLLLLAPVGCNHEAEAPVSAPAASTEEPSTVREITLFYPSASLRLSPEKTELPVSEVETLAIATVTDEVLRELSVRWPGGFVPEGTSVRAAYRIENTAIVDLESQGLTDGWTTGSQAEILAVQSLVHSITWNFEGIDSVQILVNGGESPTFAGHIDLSKPLRPDASMTR